MTNTSSCCYSL